MGGTFPDTLASCADDRNYPLLKNAWGNIHSLLGLCLPVTSLSLDFQMSASYKQHTAVYLYNQFTYMSTEFVDLVLEQHNHHLTPAYKALATAFRAASEGKF